MNKEDYIKVVKKKLKGKGKEIVLNQIDNFYKLDGKFVEKPLYKVNELVQLPKGTLLHGTYKNLEGLTEIAKSGLISSWFIDGRESKYPSSVGVWNIKEDCSLREYINFYSGATIMFNGIFEDGVNTEKNKSDVIPYDKMNKILDIVTKVECHMWYIEQTKEARFMPSLVQDKVQIGIIFNGTKAKELLKGDILNPKNISDRVVKPFVNPYYYKRFIKDRLHKDDFFTDRESAIIFGVPSSLIEGVLVGRKYEKDQIKLQRIKQLLPDAYICNLDGKVIVGNR